MADWIKEDGDRAVIKFAGGATITVQKDKHLPDVQIMDAALHLNTERISCTCSDHDIYCTATEGLAHNAVLAVDDKDLLIVTTGGFLRYPIKHIRDLCWEICDFAKEVEPIVKDRKINLKHKSKETEAI